MGRSRLCAVLVGVLILAGCSAGRDTGPREAIPELAVPGDAGVMRARDVSELERLAAERPHVSGGQGYVIGPDDLLDVRIRDLFEATASGIAAKPGITGAALPDVAPAPAFREGIRVGATGEINVPQLGVMRAEGLTAADLERELARVLIARGILRNPEVSIVVAEYRSRVVAVVGSVQRPGLYPLTRPGATIADLIWAAGGPTREAGRLVQFVAGQPGAGGPGLGARVEFGAAPDRQFAANAVRTDDADSMADGGAPSVGAAADDPPATGALRLGPSAIRIDIDTLLSPTDGTAHAFNLPVRPGDVISIPPAGNVLVDGWVFRPGGYPITRSLTLSGAIAAAGGKLFPADLGQATVRRVLGPGEERQFQIDLEAVAEGRESDLAILDGDVVHLPAETWRLVPWGLWTLINSMLHFGASVPL